MEHAGRTYASFSSNSSSGSFTTTTDGTLKISVSASSLPSAIQGDPGGSGGANAQITKIVWGGKELTLK